MNDNLSDIEKILSEREKIDNVLKSKYSKKISIMFTDIKGSTSFYESQGDIDGRAMVHRHNEIVLPLIEKSDAELVKTIGDATMSVFYDAARALQAATDIQRSLSDFNRDRPANERIHVRIGLNHGTAIVDRKDVFGDVVNVASRVESMAPSDEIYITEDMYRQVNSGDDFIFRYVDTVTVKGRNDPMKIYRVVWREEELLADRARTVPLKRAGAFVIEASRAGQKLKISGFERRGREEGPVKGYTEVRFNEERIKKYSREIIDLLNRANRRGKISSDLLGKLKDIGRLMFDELIPLSVKEKLTATGEKNLLISIDDELVFIPWELLNDGNDFLCRRFSVGRTVSTRQHISASPRAIGRPLKMLVLSDPGGDLKSAYEEGVEIKNELGLLNDWVHVSFKSTDIRTDYVKAKITNFDIVHYAGHAEHDTGSPERSGWILKDGKLSAGDIASMRGARPMPALVFSNACQSAQTEEWKLDEAYEERIFGLANALLLAGVQHYIGTFWEIPDEAGGYFARHFYKWVARGCSIGEAVRQARDALIDRYGEDTIVWASYMLYGDPATTYIQLPETEQAEESPRKSERAELLSPELRHKEGVIHISGAGRGQRNLVYGAIAVLLAVVAALLIIFAGGTGRERKAVNVPGGDGLTAEDREEARKRIDRLVAELAVQYREGIPASRTMSSDGWTSRPVTLVLMNVTASGKDGDMSVENLKNFLPLVLQQDRRVNMVEREILDSLLQELKLSSSDLADPATALKLGRILSARLMITGSVASLKGEQSAVLRIIDTETTEVRKVISVEGEDGISRKDIQTLGAEISAWVREDYPLQGRVIDISGDRCRINLGQMHGLKQGDRFEVLNEAADGSGIPVITGEIEVQETGKDSSRAVFLTKGDNVKPEARVREKKERG